MKLGIFATALTFTLNALGIIALFIILVYSLASLVTACAGSVTPAAHLPLIYFLIGFPVLVLGVFSRLVSNHYGELFASSKFKDEETYVNMQMTVVASLTTATAKGNTPPSEAQRHWIVEVVRAASPAALPTGDRWRNHILLVADRPENITYERQALEVMGLRSKLALSTDEAFERLAQAKLAAIMSDMGRKGGPRERYMLLHRLRAEGDQTQLVFYATSNALNHKRETREHGGLGCTNNAQELFEMVTRPVIQRQTAWRRQKTGCSGRSSERPVAEPERLAISTVTRAFA